MRRELGSNRPVHPRRRPPSAPPKQSLSAVFGRQSSTRPRSSRSLSSSLQSAQGESSEPLVYPSQPRFRASNPLFSFLFLSSPLHLPILPPPPDTQSSNNSNAPPSPHHPLFFGFQFVSISSSLASFSLFLSLSLVLVSTAFCTSFCPLLPLSLLGSCLGSNLVSYSTYPSTSIIYQELNRRNTITVANKFDLNFF